MVGTFMFRTTLPGLPVLMVGTSMSRTTFPGLPSPSLFFVLSPVSCFRDQEANPSSVYALVQRIERGLLGRFGELDGFQDCLVGLGADPEHVIFG